MGSPPVLGIGVFCRTQPGGYRAHGQQLKTDADTVCERVVVARTQGLGRSEEGPKGGYEDQNRGGKAENSVSRNSLRSDVAA